MDECRMDYNREYCNCTYEPCERKFKCCECLHYHRQSDELPACFFTKDQERTYNRSISYFMKSR